MLVSIGLHYKMGDVFLLRGTISILEIKKWIGNILMRDFNVTISYSSLCQYIASQLEIPFQLLFEGLKEKRKIKIALWLEKSLSIIGTWSHLNQSCNYITLFHIITSTTRGSRKLFVSQSNMNVMMLVFKSRPILLCF